MMRSLVAWTALTAAIPLLALPLVAAAAPLEKLEYRDDRLTLRATDTPLAEVIDALKRQSGAELHGTAPAKNVTATIDNVPLREALERLLGSESFALTYGEKGTLKKLELRGGPVEATKTESAKEPEQPALNRGIYDGKTPPHWLAVLEGLMAPIPVSGRLREKAGTDQADWNFMLHTASQHDDMELKADAIRAAVRGVEAHPEMSEKIIGGLMRMDDAQLAEFITKMAASIEEEPVPFVKSVVRYSRNRDVRVRAHDLIRQLREQENAAKRAADTPA